MPLPARTAESAKMHEFRQSRPLREARFGQFDRDPQIDFRHDLVEPVVARRLLEVAGHRFQPQHSGLVEGAGQQAELQFVKRIERPTAIFDGAAPAFHRIFNALKRQKRINSA